MIWRIKIQVLTFVSFGDLRHFVADGRLTEAGSLLLYTSASPFAGS